MATLLGRKAYAGLYYGVQRLRGGVRPDQIVRAGRLLDGSDDQLRSHIEGRLSALHGGTRSLAWLQRQPLMDRSELEASTATLTSARVDVPLEWRKTSGSTGTPLELVKDREMTAEMDAAMWAGYAWHGVRPGLPHARFWGMPLDTVPRLRRRLTDVLLHRRRLDAFDLSEGRVSYFFRQLRRLRPAYAYGYPSLIAHFVDRCRAAGRDGQELGLKVVITTGELLREESRAAMETFFGCRVVNEYGCTEAGVLGLECEAGTMHVLSSAAYPEVVTTDGSPAEYGEPGEVVVTDLYGRVLPLLRYRLRDRGVLDSGGCSCGRALPRLRVDSGRVDSFNSDARPRARLRRRPRLRSARVRTAVPGPADLAGSPARRHRAGRGVRRGAGPVGATAQVGGGSRTRHDGHRAAGGRPAPRGLRKAAVFRAPG